MVVFHLITGLGNGGAEGALYRMVRHDKDVQHVVISMTSGGKYFSKLQECGVDVFSLNIVGLFSFIYAMFKFFSLSRRYQPQVYQSWMYHADLMLSIVAILFARKNIFWSIRNSTLDKKSTPLSMRTMVRVCALLSWIVPTRIICCSSAASEVHIAKGYRSDLFVNVPNGYNFEQLSFNFEARASFRKKLNLSEDIFLIGCVARWHPQKDHASLLEAFARFTEDKKETFLILVGYQMNSDNKELAVLLSQFNLHEKVILYGESDDIPQVMSALDIHILSSAFGEAFPNVVVEAMACQTPVIVTDVGDAAFIVANQGIVVQPNNVEQMGFAMENMFDHFHDSVAWDEYCKNVCLRVTGEFGLSKMQSKFIEIWSSTKS